MTDNFDSDPAHEPSSPGDPHAWVPPPPAGGHNGGAAPAGGWGGPSHPGGWRDPLGSDWREPQPHGAQGVGWSGPQAGSGPATPGGQGNPPGWGHPGYGPGPYGSGPSGYGQGGYGGYPPYPPGPQWGGAGRPGGWNYGWGPQRPRRTLPSTVTALLLAVAVLVGLGIGHGVWRGSHSSATLSPGSSNNGSTNPFGGSSGDGSGLSPFGGSSSGSGSGNASLSGPAATVAGELVDIDTDLSYQNDEAAGTGIVLTSNGVILTNNHVISGATSIKVTDIGNGKTYTGTVVGYDRTHDVAVLSLQGAAGLKTASIGNSDKVAVGDAVAGLGNAGGVGGTPSVATGQVTALGQSITAQDESNGTSEKLTGLIQTDANIQPGDSGGALINSAGQVIGMDTAASTGFSFSSPGNQGFAIPINQALAIASQIRSGKASATVHIGATAFLGVEVDTSGNSSGAQGAVISSAIQGGPAAQAGLGPGDVITSLGGTAIDSPTALTTVIGRYHPGDKVPVVWTDSSGAPHQATITLGTGPAQ